MGGDFCPQSMEPALFLAAIVIPFPSHGRRFPRSSNQSKLKEFQRKYAHFRNSIASPSLFMGWRPVAGSRSVRALLCKRIMSIPTIDLTAIKIPGQSSGKWAMRALWIGGGLVMVQAAVLGLVLWKHQERQVQAQSAQLATVSEVAAAAAPVAAVAGSAPQANGANLAETAAVQAKAAPSADTASVASAPVVAKTVPSAKAKRHGRSGKVAAKKSNRSTSSLMAKASAKPSAKPSGAKSNSPLDALLAKFK